MTRARFSNANGDESTSPSWMSPWLRTLPLATALMLFAWAMLMAMGALQYTAVCAGRIHADKGMALALLVLVFGAIFNWISLDMFLGELLPGAWDMPVTLSLLMAVVLMVGMMRMTSVLLRAERVSLAFFIRLVMAVVLVGLYAGTSMLGFCAFSPVWLN